MSSKDKAKRVAIATTGGDAPGMNACIRALVLECLKHDVRPIGVKRGALGLVRGEDSDFLELDRDHVRSVLERGSTMLGSAREDDYLRHVNGGGSKASVQDIAAAVVGNLRRADIDSLILVGGDTTFTAAKQISIASNGSLPIALIPASIDNDIHGTDLTIGYDTALHETAQYIDKIRETARAFERIFIIETMGNTCGLLAAEAALISGVEELLVPELPCDLNAFEAMCRRVEAAERSVLIVVAEGAQLPVAAPNADDNASPARVLQTVLQTRLAGKREVRVGNPGYTVRGASPTAFSRLLALKAGKRAVEAVRGTRLVGENFSMIRFDRNARATAHNVTNMEVFRADHTLRIKDLAKQVNDQAY